MKPKPAVIIWSLVWASALIAIAFFFKGNPSKNWIFGAAVGIGMVVFLALNGRRNV
jgi:hypothetical protein